MKALLELLVELMFRRWMPASAAARLRPRSSEQPSVIEIPTYVEAELKELWIDGEDDRELPEGELDPDSLIHIVNAFVGWRGSGGANMHTLCLVTPGWLRRECGENGFEWGRHLLLVAKVLPEITYRMLVQFIHEYCQRAAGGPEEVHDRISQLGRWESEGVDYKNLLRAHLLELSSPDVELTRFDGQGDFAIRIRMRIGATGGIEAGSESEVFEFQLCTPDWIIKNRDLDQPLLCTNLAFVQRFDLERVRQAIVELCTELDGRTASSVIREMGGYAVRIEDAR